MSASPLLSPQEIIQDLTDMQPEEQTQFLLEREEQLRLKNEIDGNVYLLRGRMEELMERMKGLEEAAFDIDGTLTGIGDRFLFDRNIEELNRLKNTGMQTTGLTGRHYHQVADLWERHGENIGIDDWYVEQGFYKTGPGKKTDLFIGTTELEETVGSVRSTIIKHLPEIEQEFGVTFETTSLSGFSRAHQSMVSYDALLPKTLQKLEDRSTHEALLERFRLIWEKHDPNGERAKTGTSSIGTYEWTLDGLNKGVALDHHEKITGRRPERIGVFGDSGNDQAMFENEKPYVKGVIINPHTKLPLIKNAALASIGIGNATPILRLMNDVREQL